MADTIQFPGAVEWSGENPGISLKEKPDGPFTALASFFRVVLSPYGAGHALVLLQSPGEARPPKERPNLVLSDNTKLARWLVSDFVAHFGAMRGQAGLAAAKYVKLDRVTASGDPRKKYSETVKAGKLTITLTWSGLGEPFCFAFPPENSATGRHYMPSLFVPCADASIAVNGRKLKGKPVPRDIAGRTISTAMLALSETWIKV
jgi:hypothetical protein